MSEQEMLYRFNHPMIPGGANLSLVDDALQFERAWIARRLDALEHADERVETAEGFRAALERWLAEERDAPSEGGRFIAEAATREQFRVVLREYALDGLTEAQAMFAVVPRLDPASQAPVMRILIDEFGCGNPARIHANLYRDLLVELGLPTSLESYLQPDRLEVAFAFVNVYHWLTKRAPTVDYYLGALVYTESVIPWSFRCFVRACERLGIEHGAYFSEHIHIDPYHARDASYALGLQRRARGFDYHAAWLGAELVRRIANEAFEQITHKAMATKSFLIQSEGKTYRVPSACPHRGGDLSKGHLRRDGTAIACPLHGATFAVPSGHRIAGPECPNIEITEESERKAKQASE
jgi:nitrite reductase/ring-hydroxylating ferredoxin subunit